MPALYVHVLVLQSRGIRNLSEYVWSLVMLWLHGIVNFRQKSVLPAAGLLILLVASG